VSRLTPHLFASFNSTCLRPARSLKAAGLLLLLHSGSSTAAGVAIWLHMCPLLEWQGGWLHKCVRMHACVPLTVCVCVGGWVCACVCVCVCVCVFDQVDICLVAPCVGRHTGSWWGCGCMCDGNRWCPCCCMCSCAIPFAWGPVATPSLMAPLGAACCCCRGE
jgi:hypothetical protein